VRRGEAEISEVRDAQSLDRAAGVGERMVDCSARLLVSSMCLYLVESVGEIGWGVATNGLRFEGKRTLRLVTSSTISSSYDYATIFYILFYNI
jgi:hypothetical protein